MAQYELSLRDYWLIIKKRRMVITVALLVAIVITTIYTALQQPVYQAIASVQWIERKTLGTLLTESVVVRSGDPLTTQSMIIVSLPVLERVVKELGLVDKDASESEVTERARILRSSVSTAVATGTDVIRIIVHNKDPQTAADIANKIAESYLYEDLRAKRKEATSIREFIEKQLEELNLRLKNSEQAIVKFKETDLPLGTALPLENKLVELEAEKERLLQSYTPLHPEVKNINQRIENLKEQLKKMPHKEIEFSRRTRELEADVNLYRDLRTRLAGARLAEAEKVEDASLVERAVPPRAPISPNKPVNYILGILIGLMLGLSGSFLMEQLDTSIGTIEDVELYLKLPVLGVVPFLKARFEKNKRKIWGIFRKHKPVPGEKILALKNKLLTSFSLSSPVFEAYRILRINLQTKVFQDKIKGKVILISSSVPEEGKSINAANLAIAIAQGGLRVLLIDADMRRAMIHSIFGINNKEPGLSDVLRGSIEPEKAVRRFTDILIGSISFEESLRIPGLDNLSILPSGTTPLMPAELLSDRGMDNLLKSLKEKFDFILVDTPPVLAVADTVILAKKTDGVLLVYLVGKTRRDILNRSKSQLIESGANVLGVILNNISPTIEMSYNYYNYKYYGEKKEAV